MALVKRGFLGLIHKTLLCYTGRVCQTEVMINSYDNVSFQKCGNKPWAAKVLFSHARLQTRKEKTTGLYRWVLLQPNTHLFSDLVSACHLSKFFRSYFLKHINPCVLVVTMRKQKRMKDPAIKYT